MTRHRIRRPRLAALERQVARLEARARLAAGHAARLEDLETNAELVDQELAELRALIAEHHPTAQETAPRAD